MPKTAKAPETAISAPTPFQVAMRGCCPKCGQGRLYSRMLTPAKACKSCGLDYSFIDSADGPAFFVILIVSFVLMVCAVAMQTRFDPPLWVHLVLWLPLIIAGSLWGLRFTKGLMIAMQYRTDASEGKLDS